MRAFTDHFLAHLLRPTTEFRPDIGALRAAPSRIVVAGGITSQGTLPHHTAVALAERLGTGRGRLPWRPHRVRDAPDKFGRVLRQVLTATD